MLWHYYSLITGLTTTSTGITSIKTSDFITSLGLGSRSMAGLPPSSFGIGGTGMSSLTGAITTTVPAMDLSNPIVNPLGNNPLGSNPLGNNPLGLMDPSLASQMSGTNPGLGLTSMNSYSGTNLMGGTGMPGVSLHSTNPLSSITNPANLSSLAGVGVVGSGVGMAGGGISNPVFTSVNPLPTIITTSYDRDGTSCANTTANPTVFIALYCPLFYFVLLLCFICYGTCSSCIPMFITVAFVGFCCYRC